MEELFGTVPPPVRPPPRRLEIDSGELLALMAWASQVGDMQVLFEAYELGLDLKDILIICNPWRLDHRVGPDSKA